MCSDIFTTILIWAICELCISPFMFLPSNIVDNALEFCSVYVSLSVLLCTFELIGAWLVSFWVLLLCGLGRFVLINGLSIFATVFYKDTIM
jgi:hypothetical protein